MQNNARRDDVSREITAIYLGPLKSMKAKLFLVQVTKKDLVVEPWLHHF
jgi:hypothetical protein